MNNKKLIRDNYTIHIVNTDRFKSVDMVIYFTRKFNKNNIPFYSSLIQNMVYTSKKYDTKNKIAIRGEELYGAYLGTSFDVIGDLEHFVININFLNSKYTDDKYYNESVDFLFEILLNPNVSDNKFNSKYFNIVKNDIITSIKATKDSPGEYSRIEFNKLMYKGTPQGYNLKPTIEEIEEVNESNLYEFYNNLFNGDYKIDIVLLGDIENIDISYIDNKMQGIKGNNKKLNIFNKVNYEKKTIEKIDSLHFNQSKLYMGYRLDELTDYELRYVIRLYNTILGSMNNSILFKTVREDNSLCYSIGSYYSRYSKSLTIYSGINKDNYDKTVKLIKECVESMGDINIISKYLMSAKKTINTFLNNYYDDAFSQLNERYMNEFDDVIDVEKLREIYNSITEEEIVALNERIKLSVVYLLKGDN